jgi:aerobic-type carbon monoxide dehydrogenase small subunit (CoxS/CutS family)
VNDVRKVISMEIHIVNGEGRKVDFTPEAVVLWVLRRVLELVATKFRCGIAPCGADPVHL